MKYGIESVSNRDLLALILRCGNKGVSVLQLADIVLNKMNGVGGLSQTTVQDLSKIKGISDAKAIEIMTCFELAKRATYQNVEKMCYVNSPKQIYDYLVRKIGNKNQEHFVVLFLNTKNHVIAEETIFIGSLNSSVVHVREIFKAAIQKSSAKIVIAHNHPTNICIPSEQDVLVTNTIQQVGELMAIPLLDHIIVGKNTYFSFREKQLLV